MTIEKLQSKSKEEVFDFIRKTLSFNNNIEDQLRKVDIEDFYKEHRRFEMSGYETETGECTKHNISILNEFAYLGIYDYTTYLFLDFYKGSGTLYLQYFHENENLQIELGGYGTTEIIYKIFQKTIFSDKLKRRRI
ncbi:hypothetical protein LPB248_04380 [Flavobacterium sp. LPB0248]|uniref:hypothetical protein n=1 Tax=Flavobacterium sp. LPB0248 TaxID=2614441 RepID=UPI0015A70A12|nr:hypothetical protein [Flavobacterium sp. LPB0248]QLC65555.1 hypothetical protein LPB248_04380 [Flavobacterium sp. LPB0248]